MTGLTAVELAELHYLTKRRLLEIDIINSRHDDFSDDTKLYNDIKDHLEQMIQECIEERRDDVFERVMKHYLGNCDERLDIDRKIYLSILHKELIAENIKDNIK